MSRGMGAWDELLKTEGEIRKKRQRMIYEQKRKTKTSDRVDSDCYWYRSLVDF